MNQSGRSMVEMLGVLAIAAVITLGGLSGFRTAMNKFRANAIAELVAEVSVTAQTQNACIDFDDLDDWGEKPHCLSEIKGAQNGQVLVTFSNEDSCKDIMQLFSSSFGKCRLDETGEYKRVFVPTRSYKCTDDNCTDECDSYTLANCLN